MLAVSRIVALQCGQILVFPEATTRLFMRTSVLRLLVPAEFRLAAHARTRGDGERAGFELAVENAGLQQLDARGGIDVAVELAADDDGVGFHSAGQVRTGLDREVSLDVDV